MQKSDNYFDVIVYTVMTVIIGAMITTVLYVLGKPLIAEYVTMETVIKILTYIPALLALVATGYYLQYERGVRKRRRQGEDAATWGFRKSVVENEPSRKIDGEIGLFKAIMVVVGVIGILVYVVFLVLTLEFNLKDYIATRVKGITMAGIVQGLMTVWIVVVVCALYVTTKKADRLHEELSKVYEEEKEEMSRKGNEETGQGSMEMRDVAGILQSIVTKMVRYTTDESGKYNKLLYEDVVTSIGKVTVNDDGDEYAAVARLYVAKLVELDALIKESVDETGSLSETLLDDAEKTLRRFVQAVQETYK